MEKILGTGLHGLVGSRIVELLSPRYTFENLSRSTGVDITDYDAIMRAFSASDAQIVFHAAAHTDVKGAQREESLREKSESWKINVEGTRHIVKACEATGKRLIHVSTDLVLGGDTMPDGGFTEDDAPNPLSWYAETKYEAEKVIYESTIPWTIMRIAYPYRASFSKGDFVRFFKQWLTDKKPISVLTDRLITPTFIDDIASAVDVLVEKHAIGIYHTVGSEIIRMHEAVVAIAEVFSLDATLIRETTREQFLVGRPPEPLSSALNNAKIQELGVKMHTFREGLQLMKAQL